MCAFHFQPQKVFHLQWLSGNCADTSAGWFRSAAAVTSGLMCKGKTSNMAFAICSRLGKGRGVEICKGRERVEEWKAESKRVRAFANPRYLFSLSLDAMGGKTERLLCTLALAASTFSSLEWRLRQDKQNHVAVSLILIDRSCICLISLGYGGLSNMQLLHINLISNSLLYH